MLYYTRCALSRTTFKVILTNLSQGTFRENITLGETSISQEDLERACRDASILEFIQSLPQGFETSVGFKGSQMSGGQRQVSNIVLYVLRSLPVFSLADLHWYVLSGQVTAKY